jgi:hypothetical protein
LQDRIISLREEVWTHRTRLNPTLFIEIPVQRRQYLSILYITLYNNLLVLKNEMKYKKYHTVTTVTKSNCKMVERGKIDTPNTYIHDDSFFRLCTGISIKSVGFNLVLCVQTSSLSEMMRSIVRVSIVLKTRIGRDATKILYESVLY